MNEKIKQEAVKMIVSVGVGSVINDALKAIQPAAQGPIGRVCSFVGGVILSSMITDSAQEFIAKKAAEFKK